MSRKRNRKAKVPVYRAPKVQPRTKRSFPWMWASVMSACLCLGIIMIVACQSTTKSSPDSFKPLSIDEQEPVVEPMAFGDHPYDFLFDPMPLRVGTVGAQYYHRPFSPTAQRSLVTHGAEKRINYYSIDEIPSNRIPAPDSRADVYEVPDEPSAFVLGEVYKTIRREYMVPDVPPGNIICTWAGHIAVAVPPDNCDSGQLTTPAETELQIQMMYINAIPSGIGDATGDGNVDEDDFPYLIACYSGDGTAASQNCANCFDYDLDSDVDYNDFQSWFAEDGEGNRAWMAANYPTAVEKPQKTYPLRVGMIGSNLYHRPDCPAVLRSRDNHGWHKFIEFYTREDIEASGRSPDAAGSPHGCDAALEEWEF